MNHQQVYYNIILNAKSKNRIKLDKSNLNCVYYERHHIIPKCIGGSNDKNNLVLLTAREHYICHKLLIYIYKGNKKLILAFHHMSFANNNKKYFPTSRDYALAKELMAKTGLSLETKEKIRQSLLGVKHTEQRKINISISHKGQNAWNKGKKCKQFEGVNNGMYGKSVYDVWVQKYGEEKAKKLSAEKSKKLSESLKGKNKGKHFKKNVFVK